MKRFSDLVVYIVDDDVAVLDSLKLLLKGENFPVHTYTSCQSFLDEYQPHDGGCLVLDIGMPGMNGLELQKALQQKGKMIPIVFITGHASVPQAVQAFKNGAVDFIEKPFSHTALLEAIERALKLSYQQLNIREKKAQLSECLEQLTNREREVLDKIVSGKANKVIAHELGISQRTVEIHRANVMQKMQVRSLAELVQKTVTVAD